MARIYLRFAKDFRCRYADAHTCSSRIYNSRLKQTLAAGVFCPGPSVIRQCWALCLPKLAPYFVRCRNYKCSRWIYLVRECFLISYTVVPTIIGGAHSTEGTKADRLSSLLAAKQGTVNQPGADVSKQALFHCQQAERDQLGNC